MSRFRAISRMPFPPRIVRGGTGCLAHTLGTRKSLIFSPENDKVEAD
jgi:hypothetical protein